MQPTYTSKSASIATQAREVEGFAPKPNPIKPLGGPFRKWHLTPWKTTEGSALLDQLGDLADDSEDSGTDYTSVLNNLVSQAGNIYSAQNGLVAYRPTAGTYLPSNTTYSPFSAMSGNTLLYLGAAALGLLLMTRHK
jgi:hypothetical protein